MAAPSGVSSNTQGANLALQRIGVGIISDIDAGTDKISTTVNRFFIPVRDAVARMLPWSSLMSRTTLAASAAPTSAFTYSETIASSNIRVLELVDNSGAENTEYKIEGTTLFHNLAAGYMRHISQPGTISGWDPLFLEAFECRLAQKVCYALGGDAQLHSIMFQEFSTVLTIAMQVKAVEQRSDNEQILLALQREANQLQARKIVE